MTRLEKVIKGLQCCMSEHICRGCPYKEKDECDDGGYYYSKAIEDALELLKEKEPLKVLQDRRCTVTPTIWQRKGFCPECHQEVQWITNRNFCGFCGKAVKWDDEPPKEGE